MSLYGYLVRLETLLRSRQDIAVDRPGSAVVEAEPPDLSDVLAEIDASVYPDSDAS